MKTLVIHPFDPSTEFLRDIYADLDCTVLRNNFNHYKECIRTHNRIIMLGHGCENGLFYRGGMIGAAVVEFLRGKDNIYIWCHADKFVKEYDLTGFYSGMFISEVQEAEMYNIDTTQLKINYSNWLFASQLRLLINNQDKTLIKESYYSEVDLVIKFNNERLYQR